MLKKQTVIKHHIDILFLMLLFLIFTFSAVSVLLMAISSYKNVVNSSEKNSSARILSAYIREVIHQNDVYGSVTVDSLEGIDCIKIAQTEGYNLYIYAYDGYLMELNASDNSGATPEFGDKISKIKDMSIESKNEGRIIEIILSDDLGNSKKVDVSVKSSKEAIEQSGTIEEALDEE